MKRQGNGVRRMRLHMCVRPAIAFRAACHQFLTMLPDSLGRRRARCVTLLECQWLHTFRCAGALARLVDRSDALRTLRALDRTIESLIAVAMRELREALLCVARGKAVEYFVVVCHRSADSLLSVALASAHVLLKILNGPYLMLSSVSGDTGDCSEPAPSHSLGSDRASRYIFPVHTYARLG